MIKNDDGNCIWLFIITFQTRHVDIVSLQYHCVVCVMSHNRCSSHTVKLSYILELTRDVWIDNINLVPRVCHLAWERGCVNIYYLCYRNAKNMHLTNLKQLQVNIGSVFSISLVIRFSTWIQYAQMTMDGLHDFSFVSRVIQLFVERVLRAVYRTRDIEWEWCLVSSLTCNFAVQLVISRQSLS